MPPPPSLPDAFRGRRTLVLGAAGFIGRWVARALAGCGAELILADRDAQRIARAGAEFGFCGQAREIELTSPGALAALLRDVRPEVTFNLAGYGVNPAERDADLAGRINAGMVAELADAVAAQAPSDWSGMRMVHVGSAAEYGPVDGPVREDVPCRPASLYARSKLAGTLALAERVEQRGLRALTARLFIVFGPGEHPLRLLPSLLAARRTGAAVPMTAGEQLRDFLYVGEVAEGLLRLAASSGPPRAVVNLASGKHASVREFAETAARVLALRPGQLQLGALPYREDEVKQGPADISRLRELTGWQPSLPLEEGIRRTMEWDSQMASPQES
jgi:nucleoside-diphosphate-sugar epimerase